MADFSAAPGDNNDTLRWRTESEEQNLGFYLYKRVKPTFFDSLVAKSGVPASDSTTEDNAMLCLKKKLISEVDTSWKILSKQIIRGAREGNSYDLRDSSLLSLQPQ
jgi:hypothetical protein